MDYKKYIGKNAILASKNTRVVGVIDNDGDIVGYAICETFNGTGRWGLGWHLSNIVDPRSVNCNRDGFMLAIEGVIICETKSVWCRDELIKEFDLREPTLYDLL